MKIFLSLLILYTPLSFADKGPLLKKLKCSDAVFKAISSLGEPKEWKKSLDGTVATDFESGGNVQIQAEANKSLLSSVQNGVSLKLEFAAPDCKMKVLKISSSNGGFLDRDLDRLLQKEKRGVIYLWSPHMSLSVYELVSTTQKVLSISQLPQRL